MSPSYSQETVDAAMDLWRVVNDIKNDIKKGKIKKSVAVSAQGLNAQVQNLLTLLGVESTITEANTNATSEVFASLVESIKKVGEKEAVVMSRKEVIDLRQTIKHYAHKLEVERAAKSATPKVAPQVVAQKPLRAPISFAKPLPMVARRVSTFTR